MAQGFSLQQRQVQVQVQKMSQAQIHSLEILSLGGNDFNQAVKKAIDENPALMISNKKTKGPADFTRIGQAGKDGELASNNFQKALESKEEGKQSLIDNFLQQLNITNLTQKEHNLCEKLITNLSDKGYHILSPLTFLDSHTSIGMLNKCISIVQQMTPEGCCTRDMEESLFVQAKLRDDAPTEALFILNGHFDFLNPPQPDKILKKIKDYLDNKNKLFGAKEEPYEKDLNLTEDAMGNVLKFMRKLDPFPASEYGTSQTHFISPDIYVKKIPNDSPEYTTFENFENGIVILNREPYSVKLSRYTAPEILINPDYENASSDKEKEYLKKAKEFLQNLQDRVNTIQKAACYIVKTQKEFFLNGPGNLTSFTQKQLSEIMDLHESTISRMANSKYIQCEWGLFEIKYFFSSPVVKAGQSGETISKDKLVLELTKILNENKSSKKQLSDQKISDLLKEKGIHVARRTVAKYRSQMNIQSSYNR